MIYAVGDIHGELRLLEELLDEIAWDAHQKGADEHTLIFVGDYVDRGLHSREVIERVRGGIDGFRTICLKGNHEQMFLDFLEDPTPERAKSWRRDFVGGRETLQSYGINIDEVLALLESGEGDKVRRLLARVPASHIDFMKSCKVTHEEPGLLFVHAGIRPGIPLADQTVRDLIWIKEPFLSDTSDHGPLIVHGHASRRDAELLPNRINIDTGACLFGVLTAVALDGVRQPRLIQIKGKRSAPFPPEHVLRERARAREAEESGQ